MSCTIAFRVDASARIGSGHYVRCLALARELVERDCKVWFISRDLPDFLEQQAATAGVEVFGLSAHATLDDDAAQSIAALAELGKTDWVVVDHYAIGPDWHARLRACSRLLVIDDLARQRQDCDLLVNQNLLEGGAARYEGNVPAECRLLLGPAYAMLRRQFVQARARLRRDPARAARILLSFGASDPKGAALHALNVILQHAPHCSTTVVLGALEATNEEIRSRYGSSRSIRLVERVTEMAQLMEEADIALGAGGTSLWERCCLGLPSLVLSVAENQVAVARAAASAGACIYLGDVEDASEEALASRLRQLLADRLLRGSLAEAGMRLVDGQGCRRVANEMLGQAMSVRPARDEDARMVFPWRNSEQARRSSHDPRPLSLESHLAWFRRALGDPARVVLIGEDHGVPVGVLRYDLEGEIGTVSIYVDPARQGRGHGGAMLHVGEAWLREKRPQVRTLQADVLLENAASQRMFEAAGFARSGTVWKKVIR